MKLHCRNCDKWKEEEEFSWRWKKLGIRQPLCKECDKVRRRKHYDAHAEEERARSGQVTTNRRNRATYFIYEYLSNHPCVDCGEYDPAVLTFDHIRGDKRMDVAAMALEGYSIEALTEEIAKCEVVCSNCHMRRTSMRRGGPRFRKFWPKMPWEK